MGSKVSYEEFTKTNACAPLHIVSRRGRQIGPKSFYAGHSEQVERLAELRSLMPKRSRQLRGQCDSIWMEYENMGVEEFDEMRFCPYELIITSTDREREYVGLYCALFCAL